MTRMERTASKESLKVSAERGERQAAARLTLDAAGKGDLEDQLVVGIALEPLDVRKKPRKRRSSTSATARSE